MWVSCLRQVPKPAFTFELHFLTLSLSLLSNVILTLFLVGFRPLSGLILFIVAWKTISNAQNFSFSRSKSLFLSAFIGLIMKINVHFCPGSVPRRWNGPFYTLSSRCRLENSPVSNSSFDMIPLMSHRCERVEQTYHEECIIYSLYYQETCPRRCNSSFVAKVLLLVRSTMIT